MSACHPIEATKTINPHRSAKQAITVALVGQPNVGKSTVFNLLTGLNQHVGNWPGKTIERKTGTFVRGGAVFEITDLPGTYSLTANSAEELLTRDFIVQERPDVVVAIIGAATLERNLYLVAELLPLPSKVLIGLNMMDVAEAEKIHIEPQVLEAALRVRVVPMVATKNQGVAELVDAIHTLANQEEESYCPAVPQIDPDHLALWNEIRSLVAPYVPAVYPEGWAALKLLEGDSVITDLLSAATPPDVWEKTKKILQDHDDALVAVASGRYEWIQRMIRAAFTRPRTGQFGLTARLDRWLTHPVWGIAFLVGVLGIVFFLTYAIGAPAQSWTDEVIAGSLASWVGGLLADAPLWLSGLVVDGIVGGVGSVLTFLPILLIFFAAMGLLEDVGYMARAAYVMDNIMHAIGLHGKSFLPLFLGFGCNVPAVMGTRIIESRRSRLATMMLVPLIPCTARLAVLSFLAPAFFGRSAFVVSMALVLYTLSILALFGLVVNRVHFGSQRSGFIMELPLYHVPNWRTIGLLVWQRTVSFVYKAGTLILAVSAVIWALSYLPGGEIGTSYLAMVGRWLEPVGSLLGMTWQMNVALLSSFVAKENVIATMAVLYGTGEEGLAAAMHAIGPAAGLGFLVVQMLFIPCVATVAAIKQESGSWVWTLLNLVYLLVISVSSGIAAYQLARLFL